MKPILKAILIDDEPKCVRLLARELSSHCPGVQVIGQTSSSEEGLRLIRALEPDVVFLDIEMPRMNGFQLLERVEEISFGLIFVTAYSEFALKAFRFSALDYLLKPVDAQELKEAVHKAEHRLQIDHKQLEMLRIQLQKGQLSDKMALPYGQGIIFLHVSEILYCEADSNYTRIIATGNRQFLLTRTLRDVQEVLKAHGFVRVHRQYAVNLSHIKLFLKGEGSYLVMSNEVSIPVARNQKEKLLQNFGWL